ncbi:unnamed protein product [Nesidiocoris tenuis]|uniref:Uncharacterized protein n=1 Tax=Nesidiocoris tenuis TaxID=355587 RepID=A0A6H5GB39_9HEMI|nr:unnamed protein product [Nesidiocoris tenuis]
MLSSFMLFNWKVSPLKVPKMIRRDAKPNQWCVWLVGLVVSYTDARLPPKFLKATNNVAKIYQSPRYAYSIVPVSPRYQLVQSVARKEVHVPVLRPVRKKRRPIRGRPSHSHDYVSTSYHDYSTLPAGSKKHPRLRKAPETKRKPRPPPREPPEYYEQEIEDDDDFDYEYEERHVEKPPRGFKDRPLKRGYSSSTPETSHEENRHKGIRSGGDRHKVRYPDDDDEEFLAQHSELYSSGYPPGKPKLRPPRPRDSDSDIRHPHSGRKYKPQIPKGFRHPTRPSSKAYSAAIPGSDRPLHLKEEKRYRDEDDEDEEETSLRPRYKKRPRYPDEEIYDDDKDANEKEHSPSFSPPQEVYEYSPDNFYHDRKFEAKQKSKRGTEDKEEIPGTSQSHSSRPVHESEEDTTPFRPSKPRDEQRRGSERKETRRKKEKSRTKVKENSQQEQQPVTEKNIKWSIPFRLEGDDEDGWEHGKGSESTPTRSSSNHQESEPPARSKPAEKPVSEHDTAQSAWPVIGLNWKDAQASYIENQQQDYLSSWQNFQMPQWPSIDDQLDKFPLRSTFKWVEPTNQTPLHPTVTPMPHKTTSVAVPIVIPPMDYTNRGIGSGERKKKNSTKRSKDRDIHPDIVDQRVVSSSIQMNRGPDSAKSETWVAPPFRTSAKLSSRTPQQQYTVETFKTHSLAPRNKPFEGEIVYGTRIPEQKSKKVEPDIGYHAGMETVDDDIGGWQVYKK